MNDFNKSPSQIADEARQAGNDAVDKAKDVASDAKQFAGEAVDAGRSYANDAVNAVGKKIDNVKSQLGQTTDYLTKAIHDEPVKAVLVTAAVSSLLTALVIAALRSDDRYF